MTPPREVLQRIGRSAFRTSGTLSARWRPAPEFLIIGAKRCGTTSLFRYLGEHPQVAPLFPSARRMPLMREDQKGVHFFDTQFDRGPNWYRGHFATKVARGRLSSRVLRPIITGEASPYYLFHPLAPARAHALLPDVRLVVLLRQPVDRAYSHWGEQHRNGVELLDFEAAIAAEPHRLAGESERLMHERNAYSFAHEQQSYVAQSEYAGSLERWLALYARERLLALRSEDFYRDPQASFDRVTDFLEIDRHELRHSSPWNAAPRDDLPPATRESLNAYFAPFQRRVGELLGDDMQWPT